MRCLLRVLAVLAAASASAHAQESKYTQLPSEPTGASGMTRLVVYHSITSSARSKNDYEILRFERLGCLDWFPSDASGFRLRNRIALLAAVPVSINFSELCPEQKYLS
jgi:hypothetical protein